MFTSAVVHDSPRTGAFDSFGAVSDVSLCHSKVVVHLHIVAKFMRDGLEQRHASCTNCDKILGENKWKYNLAIQTSSSVNTKTFIDLVFCPKEPYYFQTPIPGIKVEGASLGSNNVLMGRTLVNQFGSISRTLISRNLC